MNKGLSNLKKIFFISSYPPKECGVATYTDNLCSALEKQYKNLEISIVALKTEDDESKYSPKVIKFIKKDNLDSYIETSIYINNLKPDLVFLQHEFGLYGGDDGAYILELLKNLKVPIIAYFHTVPLSIKAKHKNNRIKILKEILDLSQKVIVPAKIALDKLVKEYCFQKEKMEFIRHGTPSVKYEKQEKIKKELNVKDKKIIASIGLINLHKGIDLVIEALPKILKKHRNLFYYIIGEVHPANKEKISEYLEKLDKRVVKLGVDKNIKRINKYLSEEELIKYFQISNIYLTPYNVPEQVSSGTIAYAMACGRCVISTPYIYAQELIGNNKKGLLINYNDSNDIAKKVNYILDHPNAQKKIEKMAYKFGRKTTWEKIAKQHLKIFKEVLKNK